MKKFTLFLPIIFGPLSVFLGYIGNQEFLCNFLQNQILPINTIIIGFNLTGSIFLIPNLALLSSIEKKFNNAIRKIKENFCFMLLSFIGIIFLSFFNPFMFFLNSLISNFLNQSIIMTLFFFNLYIIYDTINGVFILCSDIKTDTKK